MKNETENQVNKDKSKALDKALKKIHKDHGEDAFMSTGKLDYTVELFSSGVLSFDQALGGGLPRGRFIEYHGEEHSFKTALSLINIADAQKRGEKCAFVDAEHSIDARWARKLGVNWDDLVLSRKDEIETIFDSLYELIGTGALGLVVVDSVGSFVSKKERALKMDEDSYPWVPRMMSKGLHKIAQVVCDTNTTVIFINQLRDDIGAMFTQQKKTPGGRVLKHLLSTRVQINKASSKDLIKEAKETVGHDVNIKVVKNKTGANFRAASFRYYYASGIDRDYDLFEYCLKAGLIERRGAYYAFDGQQWQGGNEIINAIRTIPALKEKLFTSAQERIDSGEMSIVPVAPEEIVAAPAADLELAEDDPIAMDIEENENGK